MDDVLRKKIEGEIDSAIKAGADDFDKAYAAAGHVDITIWRSMFGKRRGVLAEQAASGKKPGKGEEPQPPAPTDRTK